MQQHSLVKVLAGGKTVKLARACLAGNSSRSDGLAAAAIYGGGFLTSVNECPVAVATGQVGGFVLADSNTSAD